MSSLLASLISRQLRLTASKWSNVCHNQNHDCVSIKRFYSALQYNDGGRRRQETGRGSNNYDEPEQQQSSVKDTDISRRNNRRPPPNYSRDERGPSFKISGQKVVFTNIEQILSHLEIADERLIDTFTLKDLIEAFRGCLLGKKTQLTNEEILESAGMKKLIGLLMERELNVSTLLDSFGIFVKLQVPVDHPTFEEICSRLSAHVVEIPLDQISLLNRQIQTMSPEALSTACVRQLQDALNQLLPVGSTGEFLQFISRSINDENFSIMTLDEMCENFRRVLSVYGPTSIQEEEAILNSEGMKKLCGVFERGASSSEMGVNLLLNVFGIFQLLNAPASHPTFKLVLSLIIQRLDENAVSRKQGNFLTLLLDKLKPKSRSVESAEISEILKSFTPYKSPLQFLQFLDSLPEKILEDERLDAAIKKLRQLLMNETLTPVLSAHVLKSAGMLKLRLSIETEARFKSDFININFVLNFFAIFELLSTPANNYTFQTLMIILRRHMERDLLSLDQLHFLSFQLDKLRPVSKSNRSYELQALLKKILIKGHSPNNNQTKSSDSEQQQQQFY